MPPASKRGRPRSQQRIERLAAVRLHTLNTIENRKLSGHGAQRRAAEIMCAEAARERRRRSPGEWLVRRVERLASDAKSEFPQNTAAELSV